jgi:hypothetical protein
MTRARRVVLIAVSASAATALVGGFLFQSDHPVAAHAADAVRASAISIQTTVSSDSRLPESEDREFSIQASSERAEWESYIKSDLDRVLNSYPVEPVDTQLLALEPLDLLKGASLRAVREAAAIGIGSAEKAVAELGRSIEQTTGLAASDATDRRPEWTTTYQPLEVKVANTRSISEILVSAVVVARR